MPSACPVLRGPSRTQPLHDADPYVELVKALLHRAVEDAQGRCVRPGAASPAQITAEARAWLQDEATVRTLVELAGCDPEPVLQQVRNLLTRDRQRTAVDVSTGTDDD